MTPTTTGTTRTQRRRQAKPQGAPEGTEAPTVGDPVPTELPPGEVPDDLEHDVEDVAAEDAAHVDSNLGDLVVENEEATESHQPSDGSKAVRRIRLRHKRGCPMDAGRVESYTLPDPQTREPRRVVRCVDCGAHENAD